MGSPQKRSFCGVKIPFKNNSSPSPLKSPEATRLVRGEGDKGGEVDKQPPRRSKLEPAKAGEGERVR